MTGRFYTDPAIAKRLCRWVDLTNSRVLEPSAGDGSLVRAITQNAAHVTAIEVVPELLPELRKIERPEGRYDALCGDFLKYRPRQLFDHVVMNPPYEEGADVLHVEHALLHCVQPGGFVVALLRSNVGYLKSFAKKVLPLARLVAEARFVARGARFYGPDDKGETPRHDYVALLLERRRETFTAAELKKGDTIKMEDVRVEFWL